MADGSRPRLDLETLARLTQRAGLELAPNELEALLPPSAAIAAALDALDLAALATHEPAAWFSLEGKSA